MSAAYPGDVGPTEEESTIERGRTLVARHPWAAVGAAAGAGMALGLLTGGRRSTVRQAVASGVDPEVASRHSLMRSAFSIIGRALIMQALSKVVRHQSDHTEPYPGGNQ